jgi:hypothetical protein
MTRPLCPMSETGFGPSVSPLQGVGKKISCFNFLFPRPLRPLSLSQNRRKEVPGGLRRDFKKPEGTGGLRGRTCQNRRVNTHA